MNPFLIVTDTMRNTIYMALFDRLDSMTEWLDDALIDGENGLGGVDVEYIANTIAEVKLAIAQVEKGL